MSHPVAFFSLKFDNANKLLQIVFVFSVFSFLLLPCSLHYELLRKQQHSIEEKRRYRVKNHSEILVQVQANVSVVQRARGEPTWRNNNNNYYYNKYYNYNYYYYNNYYFYYYYYY